MPDTNAVAQFLPLWMQVTLLVLAILLAILSTLQSWRAKDRDKWRDTSQRIEVALTAAEKECSIHRERSDRLADENRKLIGEAAMLQARTDLKPLNDSLAQYFAEGRDRFNKAFERLDLIHREQTAAMAASTEAMTAVKQTLEAMAAALSNLNLNQKRQ